MNKSGFFEKLKSRWGLTSTIQVIVILIVFAITGTSTMFINRFFLELIGVDSTTAWYVYWPVKILSILFVYNVLLLIVGALFGQYAFFLRFERRFFGRILPFLKEN
jgi:hypothetical protein